MAKTAKTRLGFFVILFFLSMEARAESFRALLAGNLEISPDNPAGASIPLGYNGSVSISMGEDTRFLRGVELELSAPQRWLSYRGSLAMALYADLDHTPTAAGVADLQGQRIAFDPLPNKIQIVYQIPIRPVHGLRASPYAAIPAGVTLPSSFPIIFRIMPIIKGLSEELETMTFQLNAKPILSDEGAVRFLPRYPEQLQGKPFMVLIDDVLIENHGGEQLLKEGEHHLVILSDDYRNESRRFLVERARVLDLAIELQDPTPLIIMESPENARIFLDNRPVSGGSEPIPVEPGVHEVKFQVSDYTITKSLTVQRGKTYRVALTVDVTVSESD
ncbi:MAG: hypothetical protein LBN21_05805 [Treponema sp.]|jgi:hypothetical protein|nr:hypothetical protein [Treponema sp.]